MKFCENCGNQLLDQDVFCANCGTAVKNEMPASEVNSENSTIDKTENIENNSQAENVTGSAQPTENAPATPATPVTAYNAYGQAAGTATGNTSTGTGNSAGVFFASLMKKKKILIPAVAAVLLLIIGIVVAGQLKKRVNINDFIEVKFDGYNTGGTATCNLDEEGFARAILKAQGKTATDSDIDDFYYDNIKLFNENYFDYSIDKSEDLSNGDKVKLEIKSKKELEESLDVNLVFKNKEYKVADLKVAKEIDPFETLDVTFSGTSPSARVNIKNNATDDYLETLYFSADNSGSIKKGDKVTITLKVDPKVAIKKGYIFQSLSKEYTCDKVDEYLTDLTTISKTNYTKLQTEAKEKIESYFAKNSEYIGYSDLKYMGSYLLTSKTSSIGNEAYVIYSVKVSCKTTSKTNTFEPTTVYIPVNIDSVLIKASGDMTYSVSSYLEGTTKLAYSYYSYVSGYTDGTEMYNKLITAYKDKYKYQVDGDVSQFGK